MHQSLMVSRTISNLTGGKFANGAVTGAFVHMFNDLYDSLYLNGKGVPSSVGGDSKNSDPVVKDIYDKNMVEYRQGFVTGLKHINAVSTAGGFAAAIEGDTFWSIAFDSIAFISDAFLCYMGEQSTTSMLVDFGVDIMTPDSGGGKVAGTVLKQYIKALP